jgi:hypothetical protein
MQGRLLLVSNRLPITIKRSENGSYDFNLSSGGLVSGLSGLLRTTTFQWYGWPGLEVPPTEIEPLKKKLKDKYGAIPVMLDDDLADKHYNGFSSTTLLQAYLLPVKRCRLHSLATLSLSPGRDYFQRGGMDCLHRSQSTFCKIDSTGYPRQ